MNNYETDFTKQRHLLIRDFLENLRKLIRGNFKTVRESRIANWNAAYYQKDVNQITLNHTVL